MKKFIYGCIIVLFAVLASTAASVALVSCDNPVTKMVTPSVDKAKVQACLDSIVNPRFTSVSEVFELQKTLQTNAFIDSVFLSMDKETIKNVSTVVLKKLHYVTKDDIVGEFLQNRSIYENLPSTPPNNASNATSSQTSTTTTVIAPGVVKEETTTVTEAPPTRVDNSSAYKDTTIDGKKALIQIH